MIRLRIMLQELATDSMSAVPTGLMSYSSVTQR
jgi:hypothetical protein